MTVEELKGDSQLGVKQTPLVRPIANGASAAVIDYMLSVGAKANFDAVYTAFLREDDDVINVLKKHNIDPNITNDSGWDLFNILVDTLYHHDIEDGEKLDRMIKKVVDFGTDIFQTVNGKSNPIDKYFYKCRWIKGCNTTKTIKLFIDKGADINFNSE